MIDTHTHTFYSFDAKDTARDMAIKGKELNLQYMAFTDHYDRDYVYIKRYSYVKQLDVKKYIEGVSKLKEEFPFLAMGIELGYSELAEKDYVDLLNNYQFDYVLNSIHTVDGMDVYNSEYFSDKTKHEAYSIYLKKVLISTEADYPYNTISHIGFCRKNSNYSDNYMPIEEYSDIVDAIFTKIIEKGKTLEVNSNIKTKDFMPTKDFLERYYQLGGRSISFASDAHVVSRVGDMYKQASELVKSVGFTHWTVYREGKPLFIEIE